MKKIIAIFLMLLIAFSFTAEGQCAMCRAVLESGEGQDIAEGVNSGIKYLMLFPYLVIGGLLFFIYRKYRHSS
ncbi:MAG: hypothetical protein HKN00_07815 [Flavobacteriaceae bacterium]|nr:hypothetical protein [Bacteroidia bacterium]MBT8289159.1 hypothetical protein [Bacteroidia bacterium]NNF75073.1 hypothetical protein [Flavobacteriaceae bacterium]NNK72409.1 hypothetical protein [Flavobacteriaceae bacterium]